ncbi:MAG: aminomethyl transferase family protein [Polyangiaceae bacterium]|nr:aminomethyl transferase family protein [Polyangiaceae bacterium]
MRDGMGMLSLKVTPFHPRTSELMQGNAWRRWAGFTVASCYEMAPDREYLAIRNACALIDVSPLFKYRVSGKDSLAFLNRLVTRDLSKLSVGQVAYGPWCDSRGKVVDDGTVMRLDDHEFRLTSAESSWRWLGDNAHGFDVFIADESDETAALSLQGPTSRALLEKLTGVRLSDVKYHWMRSIEIAQRPVLLTRTGYTGDLGYELWIRAEHALDVWDAVVSEGASFGLMPCGIWAMDVARIEAGLVMLDVDYTPSPKAFTANQASSPFELGLGWAVHLHKGDMVGKKALMQDRLKTDGLKLTGLEIDHAAFMSAHEELGLLTPLPFIPWRVVTPLFLDREQVGYATSGTWSPTLKKYIALAQVAARVARAGNKLTIDLMVDRERRPFAAVTTTLPFFNPERKRA